MGWETLAIAGFSALKAVNTQKQGQAQGRALAQQGEQEAMNSADNTVRTTGKLTTSFLQSGLTLDGGPMDILSRAFSTGQTNISRIATNADNASKNAVNSARTKALEGLASGVGGASMFSGVGGFASDVGSGFDSLSNGTGFSLGYDASQDFRSLGGGFRPGEF